MDMDARRSLSSHLNLVCLFSNSFCFYFQTKYVYTSYVANCRLSCISLSLSPGFPELSDSPHELGHDRAVFPRERLRMRMPPAVGANSSGYLSIESGQVHPVQLGTATTAAGRPEEREAAARGTTLTR